MSKIILRTKTGYFEAVPAISPRAEFSATGAYLMHPAKDCDVIEAALAGTLIETPRLSIAPGGLLFNHPLLGRFDV